MVKPYSIQSVINGQYTEHDVFYKTVFGAVTRVKFQSLNVANRFCVFRKEAFRTETVWIWRTDQASQEGNLHLVTFITVG